MRYAVFALLIAAVCVVVFGAYSAFAPRSCASAEQAILDDLRPFEGTKLEGERPATLSLFGGDECAFEGADFDARPMDVMQHYAREFRRLGWRAHVTREGGQPRVSAVLGRELQPGYREFALWYTPVHLSSDLEEEGYHGFVSVP
jgi:hypothetical protein